MAGILAFGLLYLSIKKDVLQEATNTHASKTMEANYLLESYVSTYKSSGYAATTWKELNELMSGLSPVRIYKQNSSVAESGDLAVYPFTSPACVSFSGHHPFHACLIYHSERGRLQIVTAWADQAWEIPRAGEMNPDKGDRLFVKYGTRTLVISPQISKTSKLTTCKPVSVTQKPRKNCKTIRLSAYFLTSKGLLRSPIASARGVAVSTSTCPPGIASPCIKTVASIREPESKLPVSICIERRDTSDSSPNATVSATCNDGKQLFGQSYSTFPLKQVLSNCEDNTPCVCPEKKSRLSECIALKQPNNVDYGVSQGSSVADFLANRAVDELSLDLRKTLPISQIEGVAYLSYALSRQALVKAMIPAIESRLVIYGIIVTAFLLLIILIAYLQLHSSRRMLTEKERDSAMAEKALVESILRNSTAALNELGHEVLSPTSSISHIYSCLKDMAKNDPHLSKIMSDSYADLMGGYLERIFRAGEKLRSALKLQRRQAEASRENVLLDICTFFDRRLAFQQKETSLEHQLIKPPYPVYVSVDEGAFEEIIGNILGNARRFCEGKPITVKVAAVASIVDVQIRNEGPIIPRGSEERIFDAGVSILSARDETSMGLGLFLARTAISSMKGTIIAVNDPPPATHGVTFQLRFLGPGRI